MRKMTKMILMRSSCSGRSSSTSGSSRGSTNNRMRKMSFSVRWTRVEVKKLITKRRRRWRRRMITFVLLVINAIGFCSEFAPTLLTQEKHLTSVNALVSCTSAVDQEVLGAVLAFKALFLQMDSQRACKGDGQLNILLRIEQCVVAGATDVFPDADQGNDEVHFLREGEQEIG